MSTFKPIVCVDVDGVVHAYSRGWSDGSLYDVAVPGFFGWAERVGGRLRLVLYSSRSKTPEGIAAMRAWLEAEAAAHYGEDRERAAATLARLDFAHEKPSAWLTIDDRAIRFDGDWSAPELTGESLLAFRPWNSPRKDSAPAAAEERLPTARGAELERAALDCVREAIRRRHGEPDAAYRDRVERGLATLRATAED